MGLFFSSVSGHTSVFLMVNYTYGAGAKLEVIIKVVLGFKSIGDSVTIFA